MSILRLLWEAPSFDDTWLRLIAVFLHRIILLLLLSSVVLTLNTLLFASGSSTRLWLLFIIVVWALFASLLLRKGYVHVTAYLLVGGIWCLLAYSTLTRTGVYAPAYYATIVLIVIAGITINNRAVVVITSANLLLGLFAIKMGLGTQPDGFNGSTLHPLGMWVIMAIVFGIMTVLVILVRLTLVNIVNQMQHDSAFYLAIVNDQTEYIVRSKPDGIRTFVNDSYCRYFGITREQAIGTSFFPLIHEDDRERIRQKIARLSPTNPIEVEDQRVVRPDGTIGWQQWSDRALYDDEGNLMGYQSVGRDITVIRALEAKERELAVANEREVFLREFLSTMSHDLQTPLSVVRTNLYMMRKLNEPSKIHERVDRIELQINRLAQMIGDILTVARLENIPALTLSPAPLQVILDKTITSLQDEAKAKQITLDVTPDASEVRIEADSSELQRAFTNLVQNAIKYTPDGGKVRIGTQHHEGRVLVEIADTGIGISAEDLPHIFDRFFRANNAKDFEKGTGLGLAITKRIIELHAGTVEAASQPGSGTTFKVQLPLIS